MQNEPPQNQTPPPADTTVPLPATAPPRPQLTEKLSETSGAHVVMTQPDSTVFLTSFSLLDRLLEWSFRIGFATVFLINSWVSLAQPESFRKLIEANFVAQIIGHYDLLLLIITLNDFVLGLLILSGWKKKYVYAWAGIWLAIVTFFKTTSLI